MKKLVVIALTAALLGFGVPAQAAKVWDDMSWWGNTGAKPDKVKDEVARPGNGTNCECLNGTVGRCGYWWWPKEPASNAGDAELWGNRGIVFHKCEPEVAKPEPPKPPVEPVKPERKVTLNNVLFDLNKSVLKPEGKAEVDKLVNEMKKYTQDKVAVEGNTCDLGSDAYNQALGQRRADAVKAYMVESGVDAARINAVSKGETAPAVPNTSDENRKLNRRVEMKLDMVEKYEK